ncbi:MAG: A/G-specific adenine glycosylase [Rhodospirillaceae bacterium]|nr:A/G-specific adenine glycosylase [Rhodospirillaceae bacterium]MBT4939642.1 A/G-specific adenine glycosylase [Rhodospirillaceae bacterium]MBT5938356.1 A/G-specific adenine glycosylase [Rhodospirillaceae bacterium]MBT7268256.1 A/G-specific adenine glycosylase [Rhodospirillaceae bacterium]
MVSKIKTRPEVRSAKILAWYDRHQRHLPWRARPGVQPDPYFVWLSEIMLQQTTVVTVKSYFEHFIATWPKLEDLAAAPLDDILHAWQGLGYYARARNLHKCAQVVAAQYDGKFPDEEQDLLSLPGIGPYTAAAITAIAFGKKATPVDGNIERVMARLFAVMEPLPKSKSQLRDLAGGMTPDDRAGDYAQALMDIGATICTPKKPNCSICPLSGDCRAEKEGLASELPRRVPKKKKPTRYGTAFWLINPSGEIMLRRRREQGLLGGMIEVPSSDWQEKSRSSSEILDEAPVEIDWQMLPGKIRHTFTHFHLELEIAVGHLAVDSSVNGIWCDVNEFGAHALPTVMKKVVAHALEFQD